MVNVVVHIVLPAGLAVVDGRTLKQDITYDVVSQITPFYCSVEQVRLEGGMYIRKLSDLTIASKIFQASQEADLLCVQPPGTDASTVFTRFVISRQQWVTNKTALDLIMNVTGLVGAPGSHVLANFSVSRQKIPGEGLSERIKDLRQDINQYGVVLRSAGKTGVGGHARPAMAAKGVFDWAEKTPGRTWRTVGMGANASSLDFGSPTGGRGKPVSFFNAPWYSPPIISFRSGVYQGAYPLVVVNPFPQYM